MLADSVTFNPTAQTAAAVLADLDDCSLSFHDLAKKHGTTSDALALWLSTDEIKDRIQQSLDAMALRIRRLATSRLPAALNAIRRILESSEVAPLPRAVSSSLDPNSPDYRLERERRRHNESIRRACALLLRLANFFSPLRPPSPRSPGRSVEALRDDEGSGVSSADRAAAPAHLNGAAAAVASAAAPISSRSQRAPITPPTPAAPSVMNPGAAPSTFRTNRSAASLRARAGACVGAAP